MTKHKSMTAAAIFIGCAAFSTAAQAEADRRPTLSVLQFVDDDDDDRGQFRRPAGVPPAHGRPWLVNDDDDDRDDDNDDDDGDDDDDDGGYGRDDDRDDRDGD